MNIDLHDPKYSVLPWFKVANGEYEVCTWEGDNAQERAERIFCGWIALGRPCDAMTIRKAK